MADKRRESEPPTALVALAGETMNASEVFGRLTDKWPDVDAVVLLAFLEDDLLPRALASVEPVTFTLACVQAVRGPTGPRN